MSEESGQGAGAQTLANAASEQARQGGWLEREEMLLGPGGIALLASSRVAVVGCGGVGGYAAEMIVRAGVGHLVLLDNDVVADSNRNRQLIALSTTVGRSKCEVLASRLREINPSVEVETVAEYLEADSAPEQLASWPGRVDFVVDAIDTLAPKLALIKFCVENGIPLVSSMGAGAKLDATKVRIADLSKSFNCPLAFIVRKRLGHIGIRKGFPVVFSEELPDRSGIVPLEQRNKKSQVGTISYLPAVFGCVCAQAAIRHLVGR